MVLECQQYRFIHNQVRGQRDKEGESSEDTNSNTSSKILNPERKNTDENIFLTKSLVSVYTFLKENR